MPKTKTQVVYISGGTTFKNKRDYLSFLKNRKISIEEKVRWSDDYLKKKLGQNFEVIQPRMPKADDAKYVEWKIYFERYFPLLRNNLVLIGGSLGGIFLAKYLSENKFPKKILATYLICPPFDNTLPSDDLVGGFKLSADLSRLEKSSKNLYLLFSKDDPVVPMVQAKKYQNKLSQAKFIFYESKNGHFKIAKFPELIKLIKKAVKRK
ncbi:MAG: alpha/beta hydrolase [Candidatus Buchananbacteria bacterium]